MPEPITRILSVNLSAAGRGQTDLEIPVDAGRYDPGFFGRLMNRRPPRVTVAVEQQCADDELVIKPAVESLVSLSGPGLSEDATLAAIGQDRAGELKVMADLSKITDCRRQQENPDEGDSYLYSFSIVVRDENGTTLTETTVTLQIRLEPVMPVPTVDINLDESVEYSSGLHTVEIGSVNVANSTPDLKFTPAVDIRLKVDLKCDGRTVGLNPDVVRLGSPDGSCTFDVSRLTTRDRRLKTVTTMRGTKRYLPVPLYLDMSQLRNPLVAKEDLMVSCTWSYGRCICPGEIIDGVRATEMTELLQDPQGAELKVTVDGATDTVTVRNGASVVMPAIEFYGESQTVVDREIVMSNLATDTSRPGAGVRVGNLSITERIEDAVLRDRDDNIVDRLFVKDDRRIAALSGTSGKTLHNGPGSKCAFMITFDAKRVAKVLDTDTYRFFSVVKVEFDYIENQTGEPYSGLPLKKFSFEMRFPLYLKPYPEWLCIDYGTSAIVCKYDSRVIDLRARKSAIIKKAVKRRELQADTLEQGTPFLSSDLLLHTADHTAAADDTASLCSQQTSFAEQNYDRLAVFLSPTSSMIVNETLRQLPCLKLLVGNETLPSNPDYEKFAYTVRGSDGRLETVTAKEACMRCPERSLLAIDNVFRESYDALFRYFILPQLDDISRVNRIVLTYPNTYTPNHLAALSKIIRKAVPTLRELKFISESDAVAAYYLEHWNEYHAPQADSSADETILVYDMGAGTLDLSLIRKTVRDGVTTMDIVAKIGTCQAGNYLDFVLADIVCSLTGGGSVDATLLASTRRAPTADIARSRNELKQFVKNVLKPQLQVDNMNEVLTVGIGDEISGGKLKIGDVLLHKRFLDFLEECTDEILRHLVNFAGIENLRIDTVLMSGRSSLLVPLKYKLKNGIMQINGQNARPANFIRLDTPYGGDADIQRQKLAVSEGAMCIVRGKYYSPGSLRRITGKRIYASFGVAWREQSEWRYFELVNYRDIPSADTADYRSRPFKVPGDLQGVTKLTLIQSYLSEEKTREALATDNWDYTAEMESVTLDGAPQPPLMMRVTSDNNVMLYIGNARTRGRAPKGDDLTGEQIKRSIWPVTI